MIRHHLSDALLLTYASGSLSEGWSLGVATHLALCPHCRARLADAEMLGGTMLETIECSDVSGTSWDNVRNRILSKSLIHENKPAAQQPVKQPSLDGLPQPLRSYLGGDFDDLKWRSLGRGAYHIPVTTGDKTTTVRLLRIPAGKPVPEHGHGGNEFSLVLRGSFIDGADVFSRGDVEEAGAELVHQPVAAAGMDCICLIITDAPLRFTNWALRLLQPVLKI